MGNYWISHTGGNEIEGPYHADRDCHHCERADGSARPVDADVVEEIDPDGEERCGTCTPLDTESDSGSSDTEESSDDGDGEE